MTDDAQRSAEQPARPSRGRPAPTIDLTAAEVTETPIDPAPSPPEASSAQDATEAQDTPAPASDPPPPESPDAAPPPPPPPARRSWSSLAAAAGGGAAAVLVAALLWWNFAASRNAGREMERIAALEDTVRTLAAREPPATIDTAAVAAVSERVAKLEAAANAPAVPLSDPVLAERLAAMERRIGALANEGAVLKRQSEVAATAADAAQRRADAAVMRAENAQAAGAQDSAAERQDMAALTERLAALERATETLRSDAARQRETRADERAIRLAVAAELLKGAVARGERFRAELDAAKALAPDRAALAPLEPFADSGIPTPAALGQRLRAVLPQMRNAAEPQAETDAGFLKRLQLNAERLVRIQPVGEHAGDDAGASLARVEDKLGRGDIAGVLAELNALPPAVRAPAQDWINAARAREAAIEASRRFAAMHVGALAGPPG